MILFFHTITNSKKLNTSKTQWYYVAIIRTIVYKHFPAKFLRRKRNEKLRRRKRNEKLRQKKICNKPFLFHIKHPAAAHATKGGQLTAVPKPKANNGIRALAHHQTSQELFFIVSLTIFGKRKVFLFSFFPFFFCWIFFDNLDLKKTIIKKCLKQIVG